jgi:fructosamine-3-kinase
MIAVALRRALEQTLASRVVQARSIRGGDINQAYAALLADGRTLFVKTHACPPPSMFLREAEGLRWLGEARALRVPEVVAAADAAAPAAFLALEWIEEGRPCADHDERLGRGLALLHDSRAPGFGLATDNYLATLQQDNASSESWPSFYAERRLRPQLIRAVDSGRASSALKLGVERVISRIEALCGPPEPPARLHGDLWRGNAMTDRNGEPLLIDPAVYGGHREVDLAMMRLFGGFGPACFAAYHEARPLAAGHEQRVALYQLYPLLAHVNLFGGHYVAEVERALRSII